MSNSNSEIPGDPKRWLLTEEDGLDARFVEDHEQVAQISQACATLGLTKVLTSGTFDLLHEGHAKYLSAAKALGDVLFVGVDSNNRTKQRKGENRPVVDERERLTILSHLRSVDVVTLKYVDDEPHHLLSIVQPDIYVMSQTTYESDEARDRMKHKIAAAEPHCGEVVLLEPMATSGTTARIRKLQIGGSQRLAERINETVEEFFRGDEI